MSTTTTNSDSKRLRLESWGSNSSPLSHEIHHSQSKNLPQGSSHIPSSSASPTTGFGGGRSTGAWGIKTSPQPIQHTLSHSRSHSVHTFQSPHQPALVEPSAPTPPSAGSTPHARNPTDQQHLRSFSVSSSSSNSAGIASHYPQEPPSYYPQQVQTQQSIAPATTASLLENISPTTLAPGPSSTMPSGYPSLGPPGIMAHQQHMGGTSPVSAQVMSAVTTYPPRRKAIRAAQACDACRARKAKCDEGRPSCGFCRETQIACVYREVPPPKQDRTLLQILERLGRVETLLGSMAAPKPMTATDETSAQVPSFYPSSQDSRGGDPGCNNAPTSTRRQPPGITGVPLELDGQLAIPVQHTTAAHKLMWWPGIKKLIDSEFLENESYVMQEEEKRGPLRVYGRGESMDPPESMFEDMDDIDSVYAWDSGKGVEEIIDGPRRANGGSPMEDCPLDGGDFVGSRRKPSKPPGSGLTTGGGLKLDHQTVMGLLDSYLANMHILHPVVDKAGLTKLTFMFSERIAAASAASPCAPLSTASSGPTVGVGLGGVAEMGNDSQGIRRRSSATTKRKRSLSGISSFNMASPGTAHAHTHTPVPQRIPRTVHSTLVLLVMALGAICLHKGPVPGALPPLPQSQDYRTATTTPPHSGASPPYHPFPQQQPGTPPGKQRGREPRNIDVIPGLAYFCKAMEILGVLTGGNELENVQICLLAGLYWGQLGRVLDSWKWINYACMGCQILVRMRLEGEKSALRRDLILRAFWTCLQLESDILAELDLPPSGISRLEDSVPLPSMMESSDPVMKDKDKMYLYYLAQIALRKLLNRAHTTLYKEDKMRLDSPRLLAMARELDYQLEQWKAYLPEQLRWEESEPSSGDINAARLRAKYFGARYMIHRPFVYHVMHGGGGLLSASSPTNSEASRSPSASTPGGFSTARRASLVGDDRAELAPVSLEMSCRKCLESAIQSTTAFHAFAPSDNRPIITNVFGTAHAQFGNLLVLQAAYQCPALRPMIQPHTLSGLLSKTIHWLQTLSPISPALRHDARILENTASKMDLGRY